MTPALGRREAHALGAADLLVLDRRASGPRARRRRVTRSCTRPRPPGCESHSTRAPARGQSPSRRAMWCRPSTKVAQRVVSYHSASASLARRGDRRCWRGRGPSAATGAARARMRSRLGGDGVQARRELGRQPPALGLAGLGQAVEAPRAALGVLPLAGHEPLRLELAQQRVHGVRVDGDEAAADLADALHQPPAVGRAPRAGSAARAAGAGRRGAARRRAGPASPRRARRWRPWPPRAARPRRRRDPCGAGTSAQASRIARRARARAPACGARPRR